MTKLAIFLLTVLLGASDAFAGDFPKRLEEYFGKNDEQLSNMITEPTGLAQVVDGLAMAIRSDRTKPREQAKLWTLAIDLYQALPGGVSSDSVDGGGDTRDWFYAVSDFEDLMANEQSKRWTIDRYMSSIASRKQKGFEYLHLAGQLYARWYLLDRGALVHESVEACAWWWGVIHLELVRSSYGSCNMAATKSSKVHPPYKTKYRVRNWPAYDQALVNRGDLTVWVSPEALAAWTPPKSGKRGGQERYSDLAIETTLMVALVFGQNLRQAEGLLTSILRMLGTDLKAPDHTTLSRRARKLKRKSLARKPSGPLHVIVDSTGFKVFGQGQWAAAKHGLRGKQDWRKLHFCVDGEGVIIAEVVTDKETDDAATVPDLLDQLGDQKIDRLTGDGAYDDEAIYELVRSRGGRTIVPPRKDAVVSGARDGGRRERDQAVSRMQQIGRPAWRREAGWHQQARVENTVFRYKHLLGDRLRFRTPAGQATEAHLSCNILNKMAALGMPDSAPVRV